MLEVVGVTGVVHLGQIQSGLRSAMRIAQVSFAITLECLDSNSSYHTSIGLQGGHIKIHLNSDIPVQVDGEPWVQSPGDVVVLKSALKVSIHSHTESYSFIAGSLETKTYPRISIIYA